MKIYYLSLVYHENGVDFVGEASLGVRITHIAPQLKGQSISEGRTVTLHDNGAIDEDTAGR